MRKLALSAIIGCLAAASPAMAEEESGTSASKDFAVIGFVPALCAGGTLNGSGTFDLGLLIDTTTGLLRTDLSAPNQILTGSFCTAASTINIVATPLAAQNFTATPPSGFSRTVNYTATATGWSATPASYNTAASTNSAATQNRGTPFVGDIVVGIGSLSTGGGSALRLVSDSDYQGLVTVTLSVAE